MMGDNMDGMYTDLHLPWAFHVLIPCIIVLHVFKKTVVKQGSVFSSLNKCFVCLLYEINFGMSTDPNPISLDFLL